MFYKGYRIKKFKFYYNFWCKKDIIYMIYKKNQYINETSSLTRAKNYIKRLNSGTTEGRLLI